MAKGEQHSEKLKKKPKQDKSPTKAPVVSDRPTRRSRPWCQCAAS
jgi:hypothetical protein